MRMLALILISAQFVHPASASTFVAKAGEVKFIATGKPGFLKIKGESKGKGPAGKITITDGAATGEFTFELASLDTGIDLRNDHMKNKYLEIGKFPLARLAIDRLTISDSELKNGFKTEACKQWTARLILENVIDGGAYWSMVSMSLYIA